MPNFKNLLTWTCQVIRKCGFQSSYQNGKLLSAVGFDFCSNNQRQNFHSGTPRMIHRTVLEARKAAKQVAKTDGIVNIDYKINELQKRKEGYFPTGDLSNTVMNGMVFKDIPVIFITTTRNNTIMTLVDRDRTKLTRSCGMDGFKNTRKGTNVAAQTLGWGFAFRAIKEGYKTFRIVINGLGPGRQSAIKGLQLGGLDIVSITDTTVDVTTLRPRKMRRV